MVSTTRMELPCRAVAPPVRLKSVLEQHSEQSQSCSMLKETIQNYQVRTLFQSMEGSRQIQAVPNASVN